MTFSKSKRHGRSLLRSDVVICVLLGLASILVYNANLRTIAAADTYAARYLPLSIWRNHTVALDPVASSVAQGRTIGVPQAGGERAWWIRTGREADLISFYPIVVPIVIAPLYLPAIVYLRAQNWDPVLTDHIARIMEKISASLLAALAVMLVYLLMRRRADPVIALMLTIVFAFGTTTWMISSQGLWMHGLAQVLIAATLLLLTGPSGPIRAATAGFLCALIGCTRQPDAILAAGLAIYGVWWAGRKALYFLLAGTVPAGLLLIYNLKIVGSIVGAYGLLSRDRIDAFLNNNVLEGIAGMLVSPTRGLFVFSPFLLFVFFLPIVLRDPRSRGLTIVVGIAAILQIVFYALGDWRQGASFGPRWLTDMLPILFWMLPPVIVALPTVGRAVFAIACLAAMAIQAIGAFWYTGTSDIPLYALEGPNRMRAAWDIRNASFIAELKHPPAPADLLTRLRGHIDTVAVRDAAGDPTTRQIDVRGWTLSSRYSPTEVSVRVDGKIVGNTGSFYERPDVDTAFGINQPSGWTVTFPAAQLLPGDHTVSVSVRPHSGGESRLLLERRFTLAADSQADRRDRALPAAAEHAAKKLKEHSQAPGYWLTAFTSGTRFESPHPEMNIFLNAVLLDIAGPVADRAGLVDVVAHTRAFLTSQIEDEGLVRYHGRPDAPTIGVLGCVITPDADDTALVWRVAPGTDLSLRSAALAMMARYRTDDGLYRTWLAPRDRYACLDPGKDPNPADIAIQIHVLMFLADVDPPAARALCDALQKRSTDENIWVYYKLAPPIALLRRPDLRKLSCPLDMPDKWLQTTNPGQQVWIDTFRLFDDRDRATDRAALYGRTVELLNKIAADDFALLARDPPLLFHNDLTATVSRYYWSEDLGYAIWLRLYYELQARPE